MSSPNQLMRAISLADGVSALIAPKRTGRKQVSFRNQGSFPVYIGYSGAVTASGDGTGLKLDSGGMIQFSVFDGDQVDCDFYGIASGGAVTLLVIA